MRAFVFLMFFQLFFKLACFFITQKGAQSEKRCPEGPFPFEMRQRARASGETSCRLQLHKKRHRQTHGRMRGGNSYLLAQRQLTQSRSQRLRAAAPNSYMHLLRTPGWSVGVVGRQLGSHTLQTYAQMFTCREVLCSAARRSAVRRVAPHTRYVCMYVCMYVGMYVGM